MKLIVFFLFHLILGYIDRDEFTYCWNNWIKTVSFSRLPDYENCASFA